ncbi:MAG: hypothetical protein WCB04_08740, partial [Mycobacteriales bacterium]
MFRRRKPTLLERLNAEDIASNASSLRDRAYVAAQDAASDAADALGPRYDAARKSLAPKIKAGRKAMAPRVEAARDAMAPRV